MAIYEPPSPNQLQNIPAEIGQIHNSAWMLFGHGGPCFMPIKMSPLDNLP